jgi:transposase
MGQFSKFVGLDVHKETIAVAVADSHSSEVRFVGQIINTPEAIVKLVSQLSKTKDDLSFCYEAGPCGYGIHRQLLQLGSACQVVAPSLIPKKAGDRIKTDRRDALALARLHRAGELTSVWVPDRAQEGLRDLTRAREDIKHLQLQSKQRLLAFLLRHGRRFMGKCNWTQAHFTWMADLKFEQPAQFIVMQEYIDTVVSLTKRIKAFDDHIARAANESVFWPVIQALMALRGLSFVAATSFIAEIGDLKRFATAPQLMGYLGLVPSEHSSGAKKTRGGITKTGNGHVRRLLVEAAWTYRHPARKSRVIQSRAKRTAPEVQEIAWKAQTRLCSRYRQLEARGKLKVQVSTAIARELAGFIWAIGQVSPQPNVNTSTQKTSKE